MVLNESRFPEVTTLGSLMAFALALEELAIEQYGVAGRNEPSDVLKRLEDAHRKRKKLLEEARREKLNEVTLEPISGFRWEEYLPAVGEDFPPSLPQLEASSAKFCRDSAQLARTISPEIAKLLERLARDSDNYRKDLNDR